MKTHHSLQDARDKIYTGADDIIVGLSLLPSTKHMVTEGEKFVVDALQMDIGAGPQLFISIHGEFTEGMPLCLQISMLLIIDHTTRTRRH